MRRLKGMVALSSSSFASSDLPSARDLLKAGLHSWNPASSTPFSVEESKKNPSTVPQPASGVLPEPQPIAFESGQKRARVQQGTASQVEVSDEHLMDAYCAGDTEAFNQLFTRFTHRLVRFLSNMVGRDKAKDLTQLTFMKIHENRHRYHAGASVAAWFFAIARNNALDYVRSAPKRREVYGLEIEHGKDAPSFDRLRDERVRGALAQLSEDQRQVIQLHWFAELTFNEVAEAVGATPAAVRVRAHRGYEKLRGFLADLEAEVVS